MDKKVIQSDLMESVQLPKTLKFRNTQLSRKQLWMIIDHIVYLYIYTYNVEEMTEMTRLTPNNQTKQYLHH